jgi:diguanylate cyclase (GGDEF)-like protein
MPDISKRLEKAERYLQKGRPEAALEEYLAALDDEPRNDQLRHAAADLYVKCGRSAEAVSLLTSLLDQQVSAGDSGGIVTYKKLAKIVTPTPFQTLQYAQLIAQKDKKEALEAYRAAMRGFELLRQEKQALTAAKRMVELAPTADNLQRAGEKAASLGQDKTAAKSFVQLGALKDQALPGSGFDWYARAYNHEPSNPEAALRYAQGLFSRTAVAECITVLERALNSQQGAGELRELYARALMATGRPADAEPYAWELYEKDPQQVHEIVSLIGSYLDVNDTERALALAKRLEPQESKAGRRREFISLMHQMADSRLPSVEFLEYLVELFNSANREQEYCHTLIKVFQLYYAEGKHIKAGNALDRAAEVDPYEPGHSTRLEMLRGKIDAVQFSTIANRLQSVSGTDIPAHEGGVEESQPTVLEDFILQAEIYLQYGMRSKAVERLERVRKLFPGEDQKNEKLRQLYVVAGLLPPQMSLSAAAKTGGAPSSLVSSGGTSPPQAASASVQADSVTERFAVIAGMTRNIYRQANVKNVLFTAVNEIGRHFNASRCVAGLCTLGKPPSAALEYCAPGIKQSDVIAIVRLIAAIQQLATYGVVNLPDAANAAELDSVREHVQALTIESLLAIPLIDAGEQAGLLLLEQCEPRQWRQAEIEVLKTIAEQMVLAVSNARLRTLMKTLAVTEEKSGLLKRSSYLDVLQSEVRRSMQQQTPLTLMLLQFGKAVALIKEIGEPAVENLMQQIGQTICSHIRQNDVAVRYDLTSIALLLSDTGEKNAFLAAEKMRKALTPNKIPGTDRNPPITVGIAEAVLQPQFDPVDIVTEVINRVENALEAARAQGGNRVHALPATFAPVA